MTTQIIAFGNFYFYFKSQLLTYFNLGNAPWFSSPFFQEFASEILAGIFFFNSLDDSWLPPTMCSGISHELRKKYSSPNSNSIKKNLPYFLWFPYYFIVEFSEEFFLKLPEKLILKYSQDFFSKKNTPPPRNFLEHFLQNLHLDYFQEFPKFFPENLLGLPH